MRLHPSPGSHACRLTPAALLLPPPPTASPTADLSSLQITHLPNASPTATLQVVRLAQEVALLQGQLAEVVGVKRAQLNAELAKLQVSVDFSVRLFSSPAVFFTVVRLPACWLGKDGD